MSPKPIAVRRVRRDDRRTSEGRAALLLSVTLLTLLACGEQFAQAQEAAEPGGPEYRIEIGRHQRFVRMRETSRAQLSPFAGDGCSGGLSAGWAFTATAFPAMTAAHGDRPPWENCCVAHDQVYHRGGPIGSDPDASFNARRNADEALRQCVIKTGDARINELANAYGVRPDQVAALYRGIAAVMYRAVRLGGTPCSGLPWRWGFGWPAC